MSWTQAQKGTEHYRLCHRALALIEQHPGDMQAAYDAAAQADEQISSHEWALAEEYAQRIRLAD